MTSTASEPIPPTEEKIPRLIGKRVAVILYSIYPLDPRPRRAAEALVQAGMEVEVLCLKTRPDDPGAECIGGVKVNRVPMMHNREGILRYLFQYSVFFCFALAFFFRNMFSKKIDLVHVHNMPDFLVFSAMLARLRGAKVILDLHDPTPELYRTKYGLSERHWMISLLGVIERLSISAAHRVITVNLACRKIFGARSCRAEKVEVVMNAPEERFFGTSPCPPSSVQRRATGKPFVVMCHGSIFERHGIDLGVLAIKQAGVTIPNIEFRIYGPRTPFLDHVLALAKEQGVEQQVKFMGAKIADELVAEIDLADVGIIPNRRSIFTELNTPTRIFEYLSRGVPVISPRAPGIQDYYGEEEMIYFELGDVTGLTAKIQWVFNHPAEADEIVRRGQEIYRAHQWSQERARFLKLVEALLPADEH